MNIPSKPRQQPRRRWARLSALGLALCAPPLAVRAQDAPAAAPEQGMRVYVDPATGRIIPEPPAGTAALPLNARDRNALSTSSQGLVERPNPGPGGGYSLDVQGRFQSPLMATVDANGAVHLSHVGPEH